MMDISQEIDKVIAENGGNLRDALNVTLTRLRVALEKLEIAESRLDLADGTRCPECWNASGGHNSNCSKNDGTKICERCGKIMPRFAYICNSCGYGNK